MNQNPEPFKPKGAVAFFLSVIIFYLALWFTMYALLIGRK